MSARYADKMDCRAGCSDCCHQTFKVSSLEGELVREGVQALSDTTARAVRRRAAQYRPDLRMPCPALSSQGHCLIYDYRPRVCRKYGIPLWHPDRPHEVTTCPKNFRGVDDIDAALILDPQAAWAQDWIEVGQDLTIEDPDRTIAEWLQDASLKAKADA